VGIVLGKLQGRGILGQGIQVHAEEVYGEFPIDVVELVLVLPTFFFKMLLIHLFKVSQVEGAFGINAFMDAEESSILFCC